MIEYLSYVANTCALCINTSISTRVALLYLLGEHSETFSGKNDSWVAAHRPDFRYSVLSVPEAVLNLL